MQCTQETKCDFCETCIEPFPAIYVLSVAHVAQVRGTNKCELIYAFTNRTCTSLRINLIAQPILYFALILNYTGYLLTQYEDISHSYCIYVGFATHVVYY